MTLLRDSFIAMFGPMIIPTHGLIYLYYKRLWIIACIAAFLPAEKMRALYLKKRGGKESGNGQPEESGYRGSFFLNEKAGLGQKYKIAFYLCMALF